MKETILMILAAFSMNALVAQNNPPATNPPSGNSNQGNNRNDNTNNSGTKTNSGNMHTYPEGSRTQTHTPQNTQTTTNQTVKVPESVNKRFSADYPDSKSTWTMRGNNYRAEYRDQSTNLNRAVIYDMAGNPIGTERELNMSDYPGTLRDYYNSNYPNESYKVWSSEDKTGKRTYYVPRKNEMIWFDEKGNYRTKNSIPDRSSGNNNNTNNNNSNSNSSDYK
jgi:hypothetical protein